MHAGEGDEWDLFARKREARTESAPCLFFQGMQRGNLVASSVATVSDVSTASKSGVSQFAFLLIPLSSCPASMRNSWTPPSFSTLLVSLLVVTPLQKQKGRERIDFGLLTAMSNSPNWAARWSEVLPLSAKSGFCRLVGLFLMMRLRRVRSLRRIARRMRMETLILRFIRIDLVVVVGMADSHCIYGTCIGRGEVRLQLNMAVIISSHVDTKAMM